MTTRKQSHRLDVFIHDEPPTLVTYLEKIMSALDDLRAEVAQNRDVVASAVTLLEGLKARLDSAIASGDPAALAQLAADLDAQTTRLAEAVASNTPNDPDSPPDQPTE